MASERKPSEPTPSTTFDNISCLFPRHHSQTGKPSGSAANGSLSVPEAIPAAQQLNYCALNVVRVGSVQSSCPPMGDSVPIVVKLVDCLLTRDEPARSSSTATASPSAAGARRGAPPARRPACRPAGIVNLASCWQSYRMPSYRGYRFSPAIISHAVWLYHRFALSFRDVEDVLARRGVEVTYEAIRKWCRRFGPEYAGRLRRRRGRLGDTWHLDEVFVTIPGSPAILVARRG